MIYSFDEKVLIFSKAEGALPRVSVEIGADKMKWTCATEERPEGVAFETRTLLGEEKPFKNAVEVLAKAASLRRSLEFRPAQNDGGEELFATCCGRGLPLMAALCAVEFGFDQFPAAFHRGGRKEPGAEEGFDWAVGMWKAFGGAPSEDAAPWASVAGAAAAIEAGLAAPFDPLGLQREEREKALTRIAKAAGLGGCVSAKAIAFLRACSERAEPDWEDAGLTTQAGQAAFDALSSLSDSSVKAGCVLSQAASEEDVETLKVLLKERRSSYTNGDGKLLGLIDQRYWRLAEAKLLSADEAKMDLCLTALTSDFSGGIGGSEALESLDRGKVKPALADWLAAAKYVAQGRSKALSAMGVEILAGCGMDLAGAEFAMLPKKKDAQDLFEALALKAEIETVSAVPNLKAAKRPGGL